MIKLSHIEKIYDSPSGKVHALKGINLEIAKGEIYGIIGLSGAGKSTLVRCINMLERPTTEKKPAKLARLTIDEVINSAKQNPIAKEQVSKD